MSFPVPTPAAGSGPVFLPAPKGMKRPLRKLAREPESSDLREGARGPCAEAACYRLPDDLPHLTLSCLGSCSNRLSKSILLDGGGNAFPVDARQDGDHQSRVVDSRIRREGPHPLVGANEDGGTRQRHLVGAIEDPNGPQLRSRDFGGLVPPPWLRERRSNSGGSLVCVEGHQRIMPVGATLRVEREPERGIEPLTYALRVRCSAG